jgi:hydroxycarboxylate dehydrogenase B
MADHFIPTPALRRWITDLFVAAGSTSREAELTSDHLVGANLAGHDSHGVGMAPRYVESLLAGELQLNQTVAITHDAGSLITVDGRRGMGQSVAHQAMDIAIERTREHGVCVMGLKHAHHIGRVGHWAEQAVSAGLVSIHFTNALSIGPLVAPHGGAQARFLTNPFTVGIPRGDAPIVLDFATSAIAQGKVRVAYNRKKAVPDGSLLDRDGQPTSDPAVMFPPAGQATGALQTFAGHKGHALAMVCELLGAALIGGDTARPDTMTMKRGIWNNMLVLSFDPARLGTGAYFEQEARRFVDWVSSSRPRNPGDTVLVPGDPERQTRQARALRVPIDTETLAQLDRASAAIAARSGQSPGPLSALEGGC